MFLWSIFPECLTGKMPKMRSFSLYTSWLFESFKEEIPTSTAYEGTLSLYVLSTI